MKDIDEFVLPYIEVLKKGDGFSASLLHHCLKKCALEWAKLSLESNRDQSKESEKPSNLATSVR